MLSLVFLIIAIVFPIEFEGSRLRFGVIAIVFPIEFEGSCLRFGVIAIVFPIEFEGSCLRFGVWDFGVEGLLALGFYGRKGCGLYRALCMVE